MLGKAVIFFLLFFSVEFVRNKSLPSGMGVKVNGQQCSFSTSILPIFFETWDCISRCLKVHVLVLLFCIFSVVKLIVMKILVKVILYNYSPVQFHIKEWILNLKLSFCEIHASLLT